MRKAFLDTNILVYACDLDEASKREVARSLLRRDGRDYRLVASTQVLQEFYVTATRKLGIEPLRAKDILYSFRALETTMIDLDDINRAIDGNILWHVSFWDALIITAAQKLHCDILFTEDLNHGQVFDSVKVVNPFV